MILESIHRCPRCARLMRYDNVKCEFSCRYCGTSYSYVEFKRAKEDGRAPRITEDGAHRRALVENRLKVPLCEAVWREVIVSSSEGETEMKGKDGQDVKRGCLGCGRDVKIVAKGLGWCCYALAKKFKGDITKVQAYRKKNPVMEYNHKGGPKAPDTKTKTKKTVTPVTDKGRDPIEPRSKTWMDIQIDQQIEQLTESIKKASGRTVKIECEVRMEVVSFRIMK